MTKKLYLPLLMAMVVALFSSCSKKMGELSADYFTVTPQVLEAVGGKVPATINGKFPEKYFNKKAVVEVVINRAIASNKHVCDIIRERSQFSWVNKNTNVYRLTDSKKSERDVLTITKEIVSGKQVLNDNTKFFYSKSLASPTWATKMDCIDIGDHTFCKQRVR